MRYILNSPAILRLMLMVAFALVPTGGCRALKTPQELPLATESDSDAEPQVATADSAPEKAVPPEIAPPPAALTEDAWKLQSSDDGGPRSAFRWRHAELEKLIAENDEKPIDFGLYLGDDDRIVSANAAIMCSRAGVSSVDLHLLAVVRDNRFKLPMRRASVEALARPDSVLAALALAELIDEYGRSDETNYSADLHSELLLGLARHVDAGECPQLLAGLASPAAEVRLVAIGAFAADADGEIPREVLTRTGDSDPGVRAAAVACLVTRQHPDALKYALKALADLHLDVRLTGVAALGRLGGDEATRTLQRLAKHDSEAIRAGAIAALAELGDDTAVYAAANDSSWQVRRAVGRALGRFPTAAAATIARQLLADHNTEVRRAVLDAADAWSLAQAGPLLLTAMAETPYPTRQEAAEQLARRWPRAAEFAPNDPPEQRHERLAELQTAWTQDQAVQR